MPAEEVETRRRDAGYAVFSSGPLRQGIVFQKEEGFSDRDRNHRKIDAGTTQSDEPDDVADGRRGDHADDKAKHDVWEAGDDEQIGGDEPARAIECRLAKGKQAGETEKNIEADPEQPPDQDLIDGVRGETKIRQYKRGADQTAPCQCFC